MKLSVHQDLPGGGPREVLPPGRARGDCGESALRRRRREGLAAARRLRPRRRLPAGTGLPGRLFCGGIRLQARRVREEEEDKEDKLGQVGEEEEKEEEMIFSFI